MSAPAAKTVTRTPFKKWCDENVGLLFLIPWIIGFVVFKLYPFATSLFYSFTDMNFFDGITKIGRASCRKECRSRWSPYH